MDIHPKTLLPLNLLVISIYYDLYFFVYLLEHKVDYSYSVWLVNDCCIIIWFLNNMKEKVSYGVMFLKTAKEI